MSGTNNEQDDGPDLDMGQVLVSAVHEMKNSLALVIERLDRMGDICHGQACKLDGEINELRYEIGRMNTQLVGLLSSWRIRNRQYYLDIQENSPCDLIDELLLEYGPLLAAKDIEVTVHCAEDLAWFYDNNLISTALGTAINNAFHYTKHRLEIHVRAEADGLLMEILDDGPGFPDEFVLGLPCRANKESHSPYGTGLGLCLASLIAHAHQERGQRGRVEVANRAEGGGKFRIYLP